jgi:hypothetical protein
MVGVGLDHHEGKARKRTTNCKTVFSDKGEQGCKYPRGLLLQRQLHF